MSVPAETSRIQVSQQPAQCLYFAKKFSRCNKSRFLIRGKRRNLKLINFSHQFHFSKQSVIFFFSPTAFQKVHMVYFKMSLSKVTHTHIANSNSMGGIKQKVNCKYISNHFSHVFIFGIYLRMIRVSNCQYETQLQAR